MPNVRKCLRRNSEVNRALSIDVTSSFSSILSSLGDSDAQEERIECVQDDFFSLRQTISCLENLPNEILLEIFEFLEGEKLYNAFNDLNTRFEGLLDASNLRIQTDLSKKPVEAALDHFNDVIATNGYRIISLELSYPWDDDILDSVLLIDGSFVRLEFLRLDQIYLMNLIPLLISLADVPRLTSLKVSVQDDPEDISSIYQLIFALPSIKFLEVEMNPFTEPVDLLMPTVERYSLIEHLVINHQCTLHDLLALLSYTPQLRRLKCECITEPEMTTIGENIAAIPTLTRVSIGEWHVNFDHLETLLTKVTTELQCLTIKCFRQAEFLSAERWERIIAQRLPHLWRLNFIVEESFDEDFVVTKHHQHIHRFSSSFWIKRHCSFNLVMDTDDWFDNIVSYVISTDRYVTKNCSTQNRPHSRSFLGERTGNRLIDQKFSTVSIKTWWRRFPRYFLKAIRYLSRIDLTLI